MPTGTTETTDATETAATTVSKLTGYLWGRRWRYAVAAAVAVGLGVATVYGGMAWLTANALPHAIVHAPNTGRTIDPSDDLDLAALEPWRVSHTGRVEAGDPPASIAYWVMAPDGPSRGTVFLLHGINNQKRSNIGAGLALRRVGLTAVLVDLRGHGRSSGRYATYGVRDRHDLAAVADRLEARGLLTPPLSAIGYSYGGAVALQWAAVDDRVERVVSVAAFTSLRDVVPGYVRNFTPVLNRAVSDEQIQAAVTEAGRIAGFNPDDADARAAAAATDAAVLILHGAHDTRVDPAMARALFDAAGGDAELMIAPGQGHNGLLGGQRGRHLLQRMIDFVADDPDQSGGQPP